MLNVHLDVKSVSTHVSTAQSVRADSSSTTTHVCRSALRALSSSTKTLWCVFSSVNYVPSVSATISKVNVNFTSLSVRSVTCLMLIKLSVSQNLDSTCHSHSCMVREAGQHTYCETRIASSSRNRF